MIPWLDPDTPFPDTATALGPETDAPGLLAAGGDLSPQRLEAAYRCGIFPWFSQGQPVLWWTTDPRMVLPVAEFKLHRSLRKSLARFRRTPGCEVRIDMACDAVMQACATTARDGQSGTWIVPGMRQVYGQWHKLGRVHSFETWMEGELVGGLYGVNIGRMFYGESMFAWRTDASKIALAARPISRSDFEAHLRGVVDESPPAVWTYDEALWSQLELRA
jgi:leucyl/phenylalanyl-tRNA--protein transferase